MNLQRQFVQSGQFLLPDCTIKVVQPSQFHVPLNYAGMGMASAERPAAPAPTQTSSASTVNSFSAATRAVVEDGGTSAFSAADQYMMERLREVFGSQQDAIDRNRRGEGDVTADGTTDPMEAARQMCKQHSLSH